MAPRLSDQAIDTPAALGQRVRLARKAQGLTQIELAEIAGVGTRFISELERGKDTVRLGLALRIARLVGLDLYAFQRGDISLPLIEKALRE